MIEDLELILLDLFKPKNTDVMSSKIFLPLLFFFNFKYHEDIQRDFLTINIESSSRPN